MAISWVSASNTTYGSRTNTTVTAPAGIANDDLLLAMAVTGASSEAPDPTPPAGFTAVPSASADVLANGFNVETRIYYKFASSESGDYTFTHAAASSQVSMIVLRGVNKTTPFDATATVNSGTGSNQTTWTWTGLTTATNGAWIVGFAQDWAELTANLTPPSGTTERLDTTLSYIWTQEVAAAGATGDKTATNNNSTGVDGWATILLALKPAGASTYTLAANVAAYALTGQDAALRVYPYRLAGSTAVYVLTGQAATLTKTAFRYVRKTGNDTTGTGTTGSPWLTIGKALASRSAGDVIIVGDGTYAESITVGSNLYLWAENPGSALIRATSGNAITGASVSYVEIDGFDINTTDSGCHGIEIKQSHHITIRRCHSHDNANSGISLPWGEFYLVENCIASGNGRGGWYSGITFYQARNITGDTTTAGPRNIIRNCISYDNWTVGGSTDGNGFLMDDWNHTQTDPGIPDIATWAGIRYPYGGLVENCIAYGNGNKGVGLAWVENVIVRNCTCYRNGIDGSQGTWRGDLSNQSGKNCTFVNNLSVCDSSIAGSGANNTAIGNYGSSTADGFTCSGTVWYNNLAYDLNNPTSQSYFIEGGNAVAPTTGNGNKLGVNPLFSNASSGTITVNLGGLSRTVKNLRLLSTSPAIDAGISTYGFAANDMDGAARTASTINLGALESVAGSVLTAVAATFALTGVAAALKASRLLTASTASLALTGQAASFVYTTAAVDQLTDEAGTAITDEAGTLIEVESGNRLIPSATGAFLLTGRDASLLAYRLIPANSAPFTLTGPAVAFRASRAMVAGATAYAFTGLNASLILTSEGQVADLTITAANVVPASTAAMSKPILAGETISAGDIIYVASQTKKWMKADSDAGTEEARRGTHMAVNSASLNQPLVGVSAGDVTVGTILTAGASYYLSNTAGKLCPDADVGAGEYVLLVGIAKSTSVLTLYFNYPGVAR